MRRLLCCVLMMPLVLTACGGLSREEELILDIQEELRCAEGCSARLEIAADYGRRVYRFVLDAGTEGEELVLTVLEPELVAGVTLRVGENGSSAWFDGVSVDTGAPQGEGLSPVTAFPAMLSRLREGCPVQAEVQTLDGVESVRAVFPGAEPGSPEVVLWFDREDHALLRGEVLWNGMRVISCRVSDFCLES